jgi:HEAT repeat protein
MTESARYRAVIAGWNGDVAAARRGLADRDPVVRGSSLRALDRLGELADEDITGALTDHDHTVRRAAVAMSVRRSQIDLMGALSDSHPTIREMAAYVCGEHENVRDVVVLRLCDLALEDDEPLVRESAVAALGAIGDERGRTAVLAAMRDKPAVRRRAVIALVAFDGDDVDAALQLARTDRDWQVRQLADEFGPDDQPW